MTKLGRIALLTTLCCALANAARGAEDDQDIGTIGVVRPSSGFTAPVPVCITGFNGEVDRAFRFDMFFNGFINVGQDKALYSIQGANEAGRVEARVINLATKSQVYGKAFAGSNPRGQTHALADDICQALAQRPGIAQSKIAFKAEVTGYGNGEVAVSDYDGFNPQLVTHDNTIVAAPCWGGRTKLFYASYKFGRPEIFSQDLGSGARKPVARFPGSNITPAVSPDGTKLAMILSKDGSPNLYVSDVSGGNLRRLTTTHDGESCPCWSPDSQTICVVSRAAGSRPSLYTIPAAGGALKRLYVAGVSSPTEPDWSPDGKWIAFTANMGSFQICIVPAAGGNATPLVAGEDPVWASNSRVLLFTQSKGGKHVLSLLDVPTKIVKDASRITGHAAQPSWAR